MEKRNIEYAIGIDLGHGETSIAICPVQWDKEQGQMDPVTDMDMGSNRKVIPSAITIMENGDAYIGESAFKPDHLQNAVESHLCFKQMPRDINGKAEQIMIRFMQEIYKLIRERNQALLTDDNHIVAIATPSGWPAEAMNLYKEMAQLAGMPIEFVTKESRAAFIKAQNDPTSGLSRNMEKGAIVFDMGSSTLDFTFLSTNDISSYIDHGYDCGASFVEKHMFNQLKVDNPVIDDFIKKYPELEASFLYKTREVKEKVYFEPSSKVKTFINFEELIDDDEDFEDERVRLKYEPGELNEILRKNGYIDAIKDAMIDFRYNHINNACIYGVLLTGGASRMDFIKDLVRECWEVEKSQIYRDQDPSLTISEGVAEVARIDLMTSGADEGLGEEISRLMSSDAICKTFLTKYSYYLSSEANDCIGSCVTYFKDMDDNVSINDLKEVISDNLTKFFTGEGLKNAENLIKESIAEETEGVSNKIDKIVSYYKTQGTEISIPDIVIPKIKINPVNINSELRTICTGIANEASAWDGVLGYAAAGAAIGSFIPGIGTIFGGIVGGAYAALKNANTSTQEKVRDIMAEKMNRDNRLRVYKYMEENWESVTGGIYKSILKSLEDDEVLKYSVTQVTQQYLTEYKDCLQKSRILID